MLKETYPAFDKHNDCLLSIIDMISLPTYKDPTVVVTS